MPGAQVHFFIWFQSTHVIQTHSVVWSSDSPAFFPHLILEYTSLLIVHIILFATIPLGIAVRSVPSLRWSAYALHALSSA